jgi:pyruvate/2-oxoglutarate dehydrogenase complex dihydrolipoamide acyltransferase (E2) component
MSLFGTIMKKLGFAQDEPKQEAQPGATPAAKPKFTPPPVSGRAFSQGEEAKRVPMSEVDVVGKLDGLAASNPQKLNWKVSIVDLLKLLDIDSSYEARKELAVELGCPQDKMDDSAQMNTWLHKTVLQKLAQNGGNVPQELLD